MTLQAGRRAPRSGQLRGKESEKKAHFRVNLVPLFRNESSFKTFDMKMSVICPEINL